MPANAWPDVTPPRSPPHPRPAAWSSPLRAALVRGTRCVVLHAPDGARIALTPAAARESLAELGTAVADMERKIAAEGGISRLRLPRRRVLAPAVQRLSRQWRRRSPTRVPACLLLSVLLAPLAWIVVALPVAASILLAGAGLARSAWLPVIVAGTVPLALILALVAAVPLSRSRGGGGQARPDHRLHLVSG